MFGGGNFRNLIHACESDRRAARGSSGKGAMRAKKDAAAQYCEAVKATTEPEISQAHSAPRSTNSCVTLCVHVNITADAKTRVLRMRCRSGTFEVLQNSTCTLLDTYI